MSQLLASYAFVTRVHLLERLLLALIGAVLPSARRIRTAPSSVRVNRNMPLRMSAASIGERPTAIAPSPVGARAGTTWGRLRFLLKNSSEPPDLPSGRGAAFLLHHLTVFRIRALLAFRIQRGYTMSASGSTRVGKKTARHSLAWHTKMEQEADAATWQQLPFAAITGIDEVLWEWRRCPMCAGYLRRKVTIVSVEYVPEVAMPPRQQAAIARRTSR